MNHLRDVDFWLKTGPTLAAVIIPILTYLWLARRIEGYKTDLSKKLEIHRSQLQADFQTRFYEFQTRYSWLHQRGAKAIERLYALLARAETDLQIWVSSLHELRDQTDDEHYRTAEDHFQEMINFFDEKRIYFDEEISESFFEMARAIRVLYDHYTSVQWASGSASEQVGWLKQRAAQLKEQNISPLIALLDARFRRLLEAETPSHHLDRTSSPDGGLDGKQQSEPGFWRRVSRLLDRGP
ncbi:MAG: hypothetical protein J2P52_15220 [Blastocatellia bacterium]|nr:hypothetical protein [Blastocatellia bacterium]